MAERTALVTGASRGIGRAIAQLLVDEGYSLTIAARSIDELEQVRRDLLNGRDVDVQVVPANLAKTDDIEQLIDAHRVAFGSLDVLINNAGMGVPANLADQAPKQVDLQIAVNLRSVITMCQTALPLLEKGASAHGKALVVNMSSISGKVGTPGLGVYAATKHAVVGFTDSMNREMYTAGIRFAALCPGFVDTQLSDYVKDHLPADQMIQTADIAESVRFLLRLSPACVVPEIVFLESAGLGLTQIPQSDSSRKK